MQVEDDARGRFGLSSFTRLAICLLVIKTVPAMLRYLLPSLIAAGIGAAAACGVNYFLAASSQDKRKRFTVLDWALVFLIIATALVFEYLRIAGRI